MGLFVKQNSLGQGSEGEEPPSLLRQCPSAGWVQDICVHQQTWVRPSDRITQGGLELQTLTGVVLEQKDYTFLPSWMRNLLLKETCSWTSNRLLKCQEAMGLESAKAQLQYICHRECHTREHFRLRARKDMPLKRKASQIKAVYQHCEMH